MVLTLVALKCTGTDDAEVKSMTESGVEQNYTVHQELG